VPEVQQVFLTNFKSYTEQSFKFSGKINCIVGANGKGKTNLLDSLHYICMTRSAFQNSDSLCVKHDASAFTIFANCLRNGKHYDIGIGFQVGKKKIVKCNQKEYDKLSEHIGRFTCVLISPYDHELIWQGSEARRRFLDSIICQTDADYMAKLSRYNQYLKQRNALLQHFLETNTFSYDQLLPYQPPLVALAESICQYRHQFIKEFDTYFQQSYSFLTQSHEKVAITYQTNVEIPFEKVFVSHLTDDRRAGRTLKGIHKDDYEFLINGYSLKKFGSQGQQKSFIIALKLAEFAYIHHKNGDKPILLLDDIFDKLDDSRIAQLLELINQDIFGQVFITDARPERTQALLEACQTEAHFIRL